MKTILKIPFDKCIVDRKRRGTAEAPDVIQKFAGEIKDAIWKEIKTSGDFETIQDNITNTALKAYEKGIVAGIGGDHSVAYGLMKAFSQKFKGGLIFFDAHLDCEDDFLPPTHEDLIKAAVNEGFFEPENILIIGARKFYPKEIKFVKEKGIKISKLEYIQNFIKDKENIYISIDIDVFDPKYAPGTGYPENDGFSPKQLMPVFEMLSKSKKVKGFDICEVCPKKDINNKTSILSADILEAFLRLI
ncbi:hypothetical protein GF374_02530 [Candidatus Woesearchaeota archaeon]|nr:hypothetical protein [Candidatus Woesearchaeota archaeon]